MANKVWRTKRGMGGSHGGRGRSEKTAIMKKHSRKLRRCGGALDLALIREKVGKAGM